MGVQPDRRRLGRAAEADRADDSAGQQLGGGQFGSSVTLNDPGSRAIVGGPDDDGGVGAAWVFTLSGSTWSEQQKLTAPTSPPGVELGDGQFGYSVAEAIGFGSEALIGAPDDDGGLGAAWVFNLSGTTWNEQQKLVAPTTPPDNEIGPGAFGYSVGFGYSGALGLAALIGGPHDNGAIGAAWVFARGDTWNEVRKLTPTTAGLGQFGYGVAPSSVGTTLIGAPSYGIGLGTAWVTAFNPTLSTCVAENEITFSGGTPIGSDYQNCTLVDLHQARARRRRRWATEQWQRVLRADLGDGLDGVAGEPRLRQRRPAGHGLDRSGQLRWHERPDRSDGEPDGHERDNRHEQCRPRDRTRELAVAIHPGQHPTEAEGETGCQ